MADQIGEVIDDMEKHFQEGFRKCMDENKHRRELYYILVSGDWYCNDTQYILTFSPMASPPPVPMLNTMLWSVDNKSGKITELYVLPKDAPVGPQEPISEPVPCLLMAAKHLPLFYN